MFHLLIFIKFLSLTSLEYLIFIERMSIRDDRVEIRYAVVAIRSPPISIVDLWLPPHFLTTLRIAVVARKFTKLFSLEFFPLTF